MRPPPKKIPARITPAHMERLAQTWQHRGDECLAREFGVTVWQVAYARQRNGWIKKRGGARR